MSEAERIAQLEARLAAAEGRLARLEGGIHRNGEVPTPPITWPIMPSISANPRCPKCHIELSTVMGYVCPQGGNCPTGMGGSFCMSQPNIA